MLSIINTCALQGLEGYIVGVEVDISQGLPCFEIVGLPDSAVRESKERVRAAIKNAGFEFPIKRITVNLTPADTRKEGPAFDLPIAIGILAATGQIKPDLLGCYAFAGELSLDGTIRSVNGTLPMAMKVREAGIHGLILPAANQVEASLVDGLSVIPAEHLTQLVAFLNGETSIETVQPAEISLTEEMPSYAEDFADVKGQENAKRALEVAAAGGHNVIMIGPPGSGKTMLAKCVPTILPPLSFEEALEVTRIYSVVGLVPEKKALITVRPFRSPHHTISDHALIGGGRIPRPGEVSLAHHGVLFLDELPEFSQNVLEVMRQPLEEGKVTISRVNASLTYPARFMLIAALNPCPCGYLHDATRECTCTQWQIQRYMSRISGPLLDRIDLHLEVPRLQYKEISVTGTRESSAVIRQRVTKAREIQRERFKGTGIFYNAQMQTKHLRKFCELGGEEKELLRNAFHCLGLSMRAHDRILKVARTIADLDGSRRIQTHHLAEAIQYRSLDRKL